MSITIELFTRATFVNIQLPFMRSRSLPRQGCLLQAIFASSHFFGPRTEHPWCPGDTKENKNTSQIAAEFNRVYVHVLFDAASTAGSFDVSQVESSLCAALHDQLHVYVHGTCQ